MGSDLVERLRSARLKELGTVEDFAYFLDSQLGHEAAARIAELEAALSAANAERDELDALYHEGGTWEQQLAAAEARAEAAPPGSRVVPAGGVDAVAEPAYDEICIPPDIDEFGARHQLPNFGAATYRNGYMDGFRAALRALAEAKP